MVIGTSLLSDTESTDSAWVFMAAVLPRLASAWQHLRADLQQAADQNYRAVAGCRVKSMSQVSVLTQHGSVPSRS